MPIQRLNLNGYHEDRVRGRRPLNVDESFALLQKGFCVRTATPVNGYSATPRNEAEDLVTRDGRTTASQFDPHIRHARYHHAGVSAAATARRLLGPHRNRGLSEILGCAFDSAER